MTPNQSLAFDAGFREDAAPRCFLWAEEPSLFRVRFEISSDVLRLLSGGDHAQPEDCVLLCEQWRASIERACRRAFAAHPGDRVRVEPRHFFEPVPMARTEAG